MAAQIIHNDPKDNTFEILGDIGKEVTGLIMKARDDAVRKQKAEALEKVRRERLEAEEKARRVSSSSSLSSSSNDSLNSWTKKRRRVQFDELAREFLDAGELGELRWKRKNKLTEKKNREMCMNWLEKQGRLENRDEWYLRAPEPYAEIWVRADVREKGNNPWEVKVMDLHPLQAGTGQADWQSVIAGDIFNKDIKRSLYLFTAQPFMDVGKFSYFCNQMANKRRDEYKEIVLAYQVEHDDTETKMPKILMRWVDGKTYCYVRRDGFLSRGTPDADHN